MFYLKNWLNFNFENLNCCFVFAVNIIVFILTVNKITFCLLEENTKKHMTNATHLKRWCMLRDEMFSRSIFLSVLFKKSPQKLYFSHSPVSIIQFSFFFHMNHIFLTESICIASFFVSKMVVWKSFKPPFLKLFSHIFLRCDPYFTLHFKITSNSLFFLYLCLWNITYSYFIMACRLPMKPVECNW